MNLNLVTKPTLVIALLLALFVSEIAAVYVYRDVIDKPTGFKTAKKAGGRILYTPGTPGTSNWHIAQWNNAYELPAFNNQYSVANPSSRAVWTPTSNNLVELALNGNNLACGIEANLFAEPTAANTYDTTPFVAAIAAPLADTSVELYHTLTLKPTYIAQVSSSCITQATFITSFVLKNYDNPAYTLFYQLNLHNAIVNPPFTPVKSWYFKAAEQGYTWGFDDTIDSFGYTYPAVGQTLTFAKNIKPRLRQVVADPTSGLPTAFQNPDRWYVQSTYHGPHVWGGVLTTYQASNFRLAERWQSETCVGPCP